MRDFGDYECLSEVARGSTGIVWRARHRELDRVVAVKELTPELRGRPGFLDGFRAEARHLATLDDPHVIRLFDYVEEADRAWMAEEWVDGVPLTRLLSAAGPLTAEQSLGVLRGVLMGLAAAHAVRLVHGDVAPSNILVAEDGTAKLVDFGLAAPAGSPADPDLLGTPAYLSPETISRHRRDARSDVYSAAAVLVEMLTGRPPYAGGSVTDVLRRHVEAPVPDLDELGPALRDLLHRALAKNPDDRPADARAFLDELEPAADEEYGAGWLDRSSIAPAAAALLLGGLGGAAGGMGAAAMLGTGSAAGATAAGTTATSVTASAMTTGTATTAASASTSSSTIAMEAASTAVKSSSRKLLYLGGGGAAAGAAAIAAVILMGGSAEAVQVGGQYRLEGRFIASNTPEFRVGETLRPRTWTIDDCDVPCSGQIRSSDGEAYSFAFDGATLTIKHHELKTQNCGDLGPGEVSVDASMAFRPDRTSGSVITLTGNSTTVNSVVSAPPNCTIGPPREVTSALTLTRTS